MSKRRRVGELVFSSKYALKYPVDVVAAFTGTGTVAQKGVFTLVASSGAAQTAHTVYVTISAGTFIGTLVGSYATGV